MLYVKIYQVKMAFSYFLILDNSSIVKELQTNQFIENDENI